MITYAANIEPLFPGKDIYEKIPLIRKAGISGIEFWSWADRDVKRIRELCEDQGVKVTAFSGQQDYSLCDGRKRSEYIEWVKRSIETAHYLECDSLIAFSNHFENGKSSDLRNIYSWQEEVANIKETLGLLAPILKKEGITLLLEPLHNHGADGGMAITDTSQGAEIVRTVNSPKIRLLCDFFHMQLMHGDLLENVIRNLDIVPYVHIADAPDRHEPGTGEINYSYLMNELRERGFQGTACLEFFPEKNTFAAVEQAMKICGFEYAGEEKHGAPAWGSGRKKPMKRS